VNESSRRLTFILGAVAALAGVAVASYLYFGRLNEADEDNPPLRNVSEILTDCYAKMNELQRNLADLHPQSSRPSAVGA